MVIVVDLIATRDIWALIVSFLNLNIRDQASLAKTCRHFQRLVNADETYCAKQVSVSRMYSAIERGSLDVVQFIADRNSSDWIWQGCMQLAARSGHLDMILLFIDKGATDWYQGKRSATVGGHYDLVQFFQDKINAG